MFDVSSRAKSSVSALAERKIASARPRKYGLLLRAEEEMLLYGQALIRLNQSVRESHFASVRSGTKASVADLKFLRHSQQICRNSVSRASGDVRNLSRPSNRAKRHERA